MSVGSAGPYAASGPRVDLDWLSDGWTLFGRQSGIWILAVVIAWAIDGAASAVIGTLCGIDPSTTFSHRAHPTLTRVVDVFTTIRGIAGLLVELIVDAFLCAGLCRMAVRQARGEAINLADMFKVGDVLLPMTITIALMSLLVALGYCLCLVPGVILAGLLMFAPFYVVADGLGPFEAISRSIESLKGDWFMAGFLHVVAGILLTLSFVLCCVGEFAVIPQVFLAAAAGFLRFRGEFAPQRSPAYLTGSSGVWPPAPGQTPVYGATQPYGYAGPPQPQFGQVPQGGWGMPPNSASSPGYGMPEADQRALHQNDSNRSPGVGTSSGSSRRRTSAPRQPRGPWPGTSRSADSGGGQDRLPGA